MPTISQFEKNSNTDSPMGSLETATARYLGMTISVARQVGR